MSIEPSAADLSDRPFGSYRISWWGRILVRLCQALPENRLGKQLAFLLRKPLLSQHSDPMDVNAGGLQLRLFPHANLSDKRLLTTPFLLDGVERRELCKLIPQSGCMIDIGANVGGYSILMMQERPDLNVIAIEADPDISARLQDNLSLNDLDTRCRVVTKGVSDQVNSLQLQRDPTNQGMNRLTDGEASTADLAYVEVPCEPLLSILNAHDIQRPDHIKLDIEGHEFPVLSSFFQDASPLRWPQFIQIEQYRDVELNDAVRLCLDHGYRIRLRARMNVLLELSESCQKAA